MAAIHDYVRREEMAEALDGERVERRMELRRERDRIDQLRLDHADLRETVVGKNGDNGIASRVKVLESLVGRNERVLWIFVAAVVGTTVKLFA